jgi:hemolysin III
VLLFTASTALHSVFLSRRWSMVLGLVDHAAIYFLIAGTYFPFCMISLADHHLGTTMALAQWILAAIGIVFCVIDERVNIPFKMPIELTLYVAMGWMLVFVWEEVEAQIDKDAIYLLQVGGGFYTVGITFFVMEKIKHPIYHAVWHVFVLVAAACHYFAVLLFVVGLEKEIELQQCIDHAQEKIGA